MNLNATQDEETRMRDIMLAALQTAADAAITLQGEEGVVTPYTADGSVCAAGFHVFVRVSKLNPVHSPPVLAPPVLAPPVLASVLHHRQPALRQSHDLIDQGRPEIFPFSGSSPRRSETGRSLVEPHSYFRQEHKTEKWPKMNDAPEIVQSSKRDLTASPGRSTNNKVSQESKNGHENSFKVYETRKSKINGKRPNEEYEPEYTAAKEYLARNVKSRKRQTDAIYYSTNDDVLKNLPAKQRPDCQQHIIWKVRPDNNPPSWNEERNQTMILRCDEYLPESIPQRCSEKYTHFSANKRHLLNGQRLYDLRYNRFVTSSKVTEDNNARPILMHD